MKKKEFTVEELRARLDPSGLPKHVAVIMDGNGRWAARRGMPRIAGHKKGADTVRSVTELARKLGIGVLTLYAFSDENWGRPKTEVGFLMEMLERYLKNEIPVMKKNGIRFRVIGRTEAPGLVPPEQAERGRVLKLFGFEGVERVELEDASAGDIVALAGLSGVEIGKTVTDGEHLERLAGIAVEEPTISVDFMVNDSPFAGRAGKFVTTRQVRERLFRELERNVAMRVQDTDQPDTLTVSGRGELHLSILMETMRREGYEFQVSRPRVITRPGPRGETWEPFEELLIDVPEGYIGIVMEKLGPRRATLMDMRNPGQGTVRMRFRVPARGLFGYRSEFLTDTRGTGILHHRFLEYGSWAGAVEGRSRGVMVADREGVAVAYALFNLQERGTLFTSPGDPE